MYNYYFLDLAKTVLSDRYEVAQRRRFLSRR